MDKKKLFTRDNLHFLVFLLCLAAVVLAMVAFDAVSYRLPLFDGNYSFTEPGWYFGEKDREFYCEVIIDEANKMNQMVKKLLTLNQLEFGNDQVNMERFDIISVIKGVVQSYKIISEQSNVQIMCNQNEAMYVWGDEFKVEEVLTNYITNAMNHVKYEKKIDIRCEYIGDRVKITVFNTGDKIPDEDLDKVWIKFFKVDKARTREYGGNGIGLSIVKAIMESMNQECGVRNYDNGVAFWFTLEADSHKSEGNLV